MKLGPEGRSSSMKEKFEFVSFVAVTVFAIMQYTYKAVPKMRRWPNEDRIEQYRRCCITDKIELNAAL